MLGLRELRKGILDSQIAKFLAMLHVFAIENATPRFDRSRENQGVVPGKTIPVLQPQGLGKECR
jgi:hypothetical protein